jgi:AcrR family transcriptional regulator
MATDIQVVSKKEKTRQRLVDAARALVFSAQHEKISIQEITAAADVGLGTFYNYFDTKQDVFEAVLDDMRDAFQARLFEVRKPLKDPATMISVTLQYCFREAQDNEEWRTFVAYSGLQGEYYLLQNESQCLDDIRIGAQGGRFKVEDVHFCSTLIIGMVRHVTREIAQGHLARTAMSETTRYILRMLGIPDLVAKALTQNPLPPVAAPKRNSLQSSLLTTENIRLPETNRKSG